MQLSARDALFTALGALSAFVVTLTFGYCYWKRVYHRLAARHGKRVMQIVPPPIMPIAVTSGDGEDGATARRLSMLHVRRGFTPVQSRHMLNQVPHGDGVQLVGKVVAV